MNRILYILSPYIGLLLQYSFMGQLLPREKPWRYVPLMAIPIMLAPLAKQIFGPVSAMGQAMGIVCTLICCLWMPTRLFRAPAWKSMGLGIFFYATQFLMDAFAYFLCRPAFGDVTQLYTTRQIFLYMSVAWSVYALVCSGYLLVGRAVSMRKFRPFYLLFLIFPLSQGALLYCSIYGTLNGMFLLAVLLGLGAQVGLLTDTISYEEKITLREQLQDTRHQMALEQAHYRHADYSGLDPVSSGELDAYADRGEISSFAVPAAKWAIGNGVITGTGPAAFSPKGTTTRAQMAVMLMRYLNMGATPSDTSSEALAGGKTPQGGTEPSSQEDGPGGEVSAMPTITVEPVWTAPGAMAVVELRMEHNPGILGMALSISYPEDGLTLARVENGDAFQNILSFTPPKNLKSGCSFVWYGTDLEAGQIQDGCVLRLTFAVNEYAAGEYPIEIWTAASDIIDQSLQPVKVLVRGGAVSVQ